MRALGATEIDAAVSPMIHPECYPFGAEDLDRVAGLLGDGVRSVTSSGAVALDLPRGVADALATEGVQVRHTLGGCTACEGGWYSYRARGEIARHALVISRTGDGAPEGDVPGPGPGAPRREDLSR
jgi:copper oxidase (laccase) domain-containing protein